jgi:hypothetical protein
MQYYCNIYKKAISSKVYYYSKNKFGIALCWEHQRIERVIQERSFQAERPKDSRIEQKEVKNEEIVEVDKKNADGEVTMSSWKSFSKVAYKLGKGVKKGIINVADSTKKWAQKRKWKTIILRRMKMIQLKQLCFEHNISIKKTIEKEGKYFGEIIESKATNIGKAIMQFENTLDKLNRKRIKGIDFNCVSHIQNRTISLAPVSS